MSPSRTPKDNQPTTPAAPGPEVKVPGPAAPAPKDRLAGEIFWLQEVIAKLNETYRPGFFDNNKTVLKNLVAEVKQLKTETQLNEFYIKLREQFLNGAVNAIPSADTNKTPKHAVELYANAINDRTPKAINDRFLQTIFWILSKVMHRPKLNHGVRYDIFEPVRNVTFEPYFLSGAPQLNTLAPKKPANPAATAATAAANATAAATSAATAAAVAVRAITDADANSAATAAAVAADTATKAAVVAVAAAKDAAAASAVAVAADLAASVSLQAAAGIRADAVTVAAAIDAAKIVADTAADIAQATSAKAEAAAASAKIATAAAAAAVASAVAAAKAAAVSHPIAVARITAAAAGTTAAINLATATAAGTTPAIARDTAAAARSNAELRMVAAKVVAYLSSVSGAEKAYQDALQMVSYLTEKDEDPARLKTLATSVVNFLQIILQKHDEEVARLTDIAMKNALDAKATPITEARQLAERDYAAFTDAATKAAVVRDLLHRTQKAFGIENVPIATVAPESKAAAMLPTAAGTTVPAADATDNLRIVEIISAISPSFTPAAMKLVAQQIKPDEDPGELILATKNVVDFLETNILDTPEKVISFIETSQRLKIEVANAARSLSAHPDDKSAKARHETAKRSADSFDKMATGAKVHELHDLVPQIVAATVITYLKSIGASNIDNPEANTKEKALADAIYISQSLERKDNNSIEFKAAAQRVVTFLEEKFSAASIAVPLLTKESPKAHRRVEEALLKRRLAGKAAEPTNIESARTRLEAAQRSADRIEKQKEIANADVISLPELVRLAAKAFGIGEPKLKAAAAAAPAPPPLTGTRRKKP